MDIVISFIKKKKKYNLFDTKLLNFFRLIVLLKNGANPGYKQLF